MFRLGEVELKVVHDASLDRLILLSPLLSHDLDLFLGESDFKFVPLVLKFNTGMNRLGFSIQELEQVIHRLKKAGRKEIFHLMSHFACASSKSTMNNQQDRSFQEINGIHTKYE